MKPSSWDKQLGLASPLGRAAGQSDETNHPSKNEVGLDVSHHTHVSPEGRGKYFFLDILSHRMGAIGLDIGKWFVLGALVLGAVVALLRDCPELR